MVVPTKTTPQTPAGPVKLTVGIEESRAQRHQRQLNRFRDRGGIFVPTTRNTLADILMGRRAVSPKRKSLRRAASPQKSLRRSVSPIKRDTKSGDVANNKRAASPAKVSRKDRVLGSPQKSLRRSASPIKRDTKSEDVVGNKRAASPAKAPPKIRVPKATSSGQMQKKRKLEAEPQETQPTFIGSEDTKTQPKRRATRTRKVEESLDGEQEKTVKLKNAPKSKPAPRKKRAQSQKPAKSKAEAKVLKPPKGLPERVLQRLKNSVPDTTDDEPDPINFLS